MEWTSVIKSSLFFILRVLLVLLLIAVAFAVGAMLGYSVLGDGSDPMDVFNLDMWRNIMNFIF